MFDISIELSTKTIKRLYYYIVNRFLIKRLSKKNKLPLTNSNSKNSIYLLIDNVVLSQVESLKV